MDVNNIDENIKLKEVLKEYKTVLNDLQLFLKTLPKKYQNNPELLYDLDRLYNNKLRVIEEGLNRPYFARIDFKSDSELKEDICYIGKVGVTDFDNNIVTVDWRAPIASLYYDSNVGRTSYEAPDGTIGGSLNLKRQYNIEKGELISYNDVDTVSNDEILKPYLSVNADNRLKNIVSSIQNEQNAVIRKNLSDNLIVQGVAGSGKTTVALHRIAYLAYNFRDKIKSNQYLIIGPNKFFNKYISSVLPDLDVTGVPQLTYEEFTREYLDEEFNVEDGIISNTKFNSNRFKMSLEYKTVIDNYIKYLEENVVIPDKDFCIKDFNLVSSKIIKDIYINIDNSYQPDIESKIERTILMTSNYLKNNYDSILTSINKRYHELLDKTKNDKEKKQLLDTYTSIKNELSSSGCTSSLRKYFSIKNKKTTLLYNELLKTVTSYYEDENISEIKDNILKRKSTYEFEDLPGLVYLNYRLHGSKDYKQYRQTVIDEAQDYGTFNFYALKKVLSSSSFSIFGDLAQSIYDYRSIDNWDSVIKDSFQDDCELNYLLKSYRTTVEIMNSANLVLEYIGLKAATPVIRHGENVKFIKVDKDIYQKLQELVLSLKNENYENVALISRTNSDAKQISDELLKLGMEVTNISGNNSDYEGGICSVSSELSKGLEFDAVIITDASERKFSSSNTNDMKNLYVSMTRPLHKLDVLYTEDITEPLKKVKQKK